MAKPKITPRKIKDPSIKTLQRKTKRILRKSTKEFKKRFPNLDKIQELLEQATILLKKSTETLIDQSKQRKKRRKKNKSNVKLSYTLAKNYERHAAKFNTTSCSYKAKVSLEEENNVKMKDAMNSLENLFSDLITDVSNKCNLRNNNDRMRILVTSDKLKKPLSTRLVKLEEQKPSLILSEIAKVLQSEEDIPLDSSFNVEVVSVRIPSGSGYFKVLNYSKHSKLKRAIITIKNRDDLCLSWALIVGRAMALNSPKLKQITV